MGRHVDLIELMGLTGVQCPICNDELIYLEGIDMDCDTVSRSPNSFECDVNCVNCDNEVTVKFDINFEVQRK